jgi:methylmalonyl-CoA mutase N-terminal domain/subunit
MTEKSIFDRYLEGERPPDYLTRTGIELDPDYSGRPRRELEKPAEYPFTRGIHPEMYRKRLWTRRQQSGFGTPRDSNARLLYLLKQGQTGLNIDFDVATKIGIDPDHPLGEGDVGLQGTSIATFEDMETLFDGIPQDKVSATLIAQPPTSTTIVAQYLLLARKRGVPPEKLIGTIMNCAFTQLVGPTLQANDFFFPIDFSLRLALDVMEFCNKVMPRWNTININAYNIRDTGLDAVQEAAWSFSLAMEYIDGLLARGLDIDEFAPRIAFFSAAHIDLFEEAAKLRAMRRVWARLIKERYGAMNERSCWFRTAIQTSALPLTRQEPYNNLVRATIQTLAAVLGGAQSIHTTSYDEAFALPTEESHKLSLRTQQIIAFESNVVKTVDPLGGSYFVEALTDELEEKIWALLDDMQDRGGYAQLFKEGWIERHINEARMANIEKFETATQPSIGANVFVDDDVGEPELAFNRIGRPTIEERIATVQAYRANREQSGVAPALKAVAAAAAEPNTNTMESVIAAVEACATVGEISDAFREGIGYEVPA